MVKCYESGGRKTNGDPCNSNAMANGKCYKHGGATPKGVHSPHYKHGRRSKYNPINIAKRIENSLNDPNLLSIKHDIAVTQAFIDDQLAKIDDVPDAAKSWIQIGQIIDTIDKAFASGEAEKILDARMQIPKARGIISKQQRFHEGVKDVQHGLDMKRKQLATKAQIEVASDKAMSYDEAKMFMHTMFILIDTHMNNPEEKQAFTLALHQHARLIAGV